MSFFGSLLGKKVPYVGGGMGGLMDLKLEGRDQKRLFQMLMEEFSLHLETEDMEEIRKKLGHQIKMYTR